MPINRIVKLAGAETTLKAIRFSLIFVFLLSLAACDRANKVFEGHQSFNIWPGAAPGPDDWPDRELEGFRSVTNVSTPTLIMFEPDPSLANGNAVVVCPGGGFTGLSVIKEGSAVAEWLAARGITAFVLKYRVRRDLVDSAVSEDDDFQQRIKAREAGRRIAAADGIQAMRYLRENAQALNINPEKIGLMGFSAGAMTTMSVVLEGSGDSRPNFAASIYGGMPDQDVPDNFAPDNAPPLFLAHAKDDEVVPLDRSLVMQAAWQAAGLPVELHVFETGGHGFGNVKQDKDSDTWMEKFENWLIKIGWIGR